MVNYLLDNFKIMFKDIFSGDKEKFKEQFANLLTSIRGALAPILIIISLIIDSTKMSFIIILLSAITDSFDGWYARKNGYVSEFGAVLDTICDKIFTFCIILPIVKVSPYLLIAILIMEIMIGILNSYVHLKGSSNKSSILGKIKTAVLYITIVLCYLSLLLNFNKLIIISCLIISIILQVIAFLDYLFRSIMKRKSMKNKSQ